jgi:hypothetical protein
MAEKSPRKRNQKKSEKERQELHRKLDQILDWTPSERFGMSKFMLLASIYSTHQHMRADSKGLGNLRVDTDKVVRETKKALQIVR